MSVTSDFLPSKGVEENPRAHGGPRDHEWTSRESRSVQAGARRAACSVDEPAARRLDPLRRRQRDHLRLGPQPPRPAGGHRGGQGQSSHAHRSSRHAEAGSAHRRRADSVCSHGRRKGASAPLNPAWPRETFANCNRKLPMPMANVSALIDFISIFSCTLPDTEQGAGWGLVARNRCPHQPYWSPSNTSSSGRWRWTPEGSTAWRSPPKEKCTRGVRPRMENWVMGTEGKNFWNSRMILTFNSWS